MESRDTLVEIETLETPLLPSNDQLSTANTVGDSKTEEESPILYTASFTETEEGFIKYQTSKWLLYSLLLILAWGFGLLMILYLPVRRFVLRNDIRSRKLYLTADAIVYKVTRPVSFPCFGELKKEKYVLLPSVSDIVIEQGYLQSFYDLYSVRIENIGVRRSPSDDLQIQGVANPNAFRKAVLTHLANLKTETLPGQSSLTKDAPQTSEHFPSKSFIQDAIPPSEQVLIQKLEEVGSSIKRVQTLIEEQRNQQ